MADPYWFVPRRFGYAATPVTWQGWVLTVAMAAPLLLNSVWWRSRRDVFCGAVVLDGGGALAYVNTGECQYGRALAVAVLGKPSFSRKRSRKLLHALSREAETPRIITAHLRTQKFLRSSLQKRSAYL